MRFDTDDVDIYIIIWKKKHGKIMKIPKVS